jgi:TetR/AcrR family transcriptional regulator, regulator of cefoperazone and chloramphenicol sensitivity
MRSIEHGGRRPEDLTAQARIREAAVELFASGGYSGTSIRDVARAAGVSPGLVQHHFGSKEGLREACDAHVTEVLRTVTALKLERSEYDSDFITTLFESSAPIMRYIARGLTEEWPGMVGIFDQAAGDTERWLADTWPDRFPAGSEAGRLHAAYLAAMSLGTLALHSHVARWIGQDPLTAEHQPVRSGAVLEVMLRLAEFIGTEQGRSMRSALADYERGPKTPEGRDRDE